MEPQALDYPRALAKLLELLGQHVEVTLRGLATPHAPFSTWRDRRTRRRSAGTPTHCASQSAMLA